MWDAFAKLNSNRNERGFSLVEMSVTVGIVMAMSLSLVAFNEYIIKEESLTRAKFESMELRTLLRGKLVSQARNLAIPETCYDRLNLTGTEVFNPANAFELPVAALAPETKSVKTDRIFLDQARLLRSNGGLSEYTTLLKVEQSLKAVGTTHKMPLSVLGVLKVTVDSSNFIVGCNWDDSSADAADVCDSIDGVYNTTSGPVNCNFEANIPIALGTCPGNSVRDLVSNRCIPSSMPCAARELANGYSTDGSMIDCEPVPVEYGVTYPPPPQPNEPPPTPNDPPIQAPTQPPRQPASPPPPTQCRCGGQPIAAGSDVLCVHATSVSDGIFGANDDYFDVKVCNSAGNLEDAQGYFDEEGNNSNWFWRISQCQAFGGIKNTRGRSYKRGRCW